MDKYLKKMFDGDVHPRIVKKLGNGRFAEVYLLENGNVVKLLRNIKNKDSYIREEIENQTLAHSYGLAPKIHSHIILKPITEEGMSNEMVIKNYDFNKPINCIFMEHIPNSVVDWLSTPRTFAELVNLVERIVSIIEILAKNNFTHGDLHWGNISFNDDYSKLYLLDYGHSQTDKSRVDGEFWQLLRTLGYSPADEEDCQYDPTLKLGEEVAYFKKIHPSNATTLYNLLVNQASRLGVHLGSLKKYRNLKNRQDYIERMQVESLK